jgi:glycerate 2-kinase
LVHRTVLRHDRGVPATIQNRGSLLADLPDADRRRRETALDLADAALAAADPGPATARVLDSWRQAGWPQTPIQILAIGKAAAAMANAALAHIDATSGFILGGQAEGLTSLPASHPLPHRDAADSAAILRAELTEPTLVLLSGGGSAMLCDPVPGVTVDDLRHTHGVLLRSGLDVGAINAIRGTLDRMKGGGLGRLLAPGSRAIVLSDVPGHEPDVVASGPLSPPPPIPRLPAGLRLHVADLIRASQSPPPPPRIPMEVCADNASVCAAVAAVARSWDLAVRNDPLHLHGEAALAGQTFAVGSSPRIGGGETTVTVRGDGVGGRNQEFALGAWMCDGLVLALATDGVDGPSRSAGALLDDAVLRRAKELGLDIIDHLARNDADAFFRAAGGRLETGPTGTNVADIAFFLP